RSLLYGADGVVIKFQKQICFGNESPFITGCALSRITGCALSRITGCALSRITGCALSRITGCALSRITGCALSRLHSLRPCQSARVEDASRLSIDRAATPHRGGE